MNNDKAYEFDKPHPGESLDAYLHRHRAHPSDDNPRTASGADEQEVDKTDLYKDQAFTITKK